jgi:glycine/serine hydroxymethyltransferase
MEHGRMLTERANLEVPHCHFVNHTTHINYPSTEPGLILCEAGGQPILN